MEISTKNWIVLATLLLVLQLSNAQFCNTAGELKCISNTGYLPCTTTGPNYLANILTCDANQGCYGIGATKTDICFDAPCTGGQRNYPIPGKPNAYYFCAGLNAATYAGVDTCPASTTFNGGTCVPSVITTTVPPTTAPPASITSPPTCSGQKLLPDPKSCNHYYVCAGATSGPATRTKCPLKMRFDVLIRRCRIRFTTNCGDRPETV